MERESERIKSFIVKLKNKIIECRKRLDKRTFKHPLKGKALIRRIKYSNQQMTEGNEWKLIKY